MLPRCISVWDQNTLIYTDQTGGNATVTIIYKRQK